MEKALSVAKSAFDQINALKSANPIAFWSTAAVGGFTQLLLMRRYFQGGKNKHTDADLTGKVAIITGGNTGIGKETAIALACMGATVILACRDMNRGTEAVADVRHQASSMNVHYMNLDLADLASVRSFAEEFKKKYNSLHFMICNAGVMACPPLKTKDGFEMQFGTNHLGHFLLVNLLLSVLQTSAPSRVVVVSSMAHKWGKTDFDDLMSERKKYKTWGVYGQSKLANILFASELNRRLKGTGVVANSLHPGAVNTELSRHQVNKNIFTRAFFGLFTPVSWLLMKTPWYGAQTTLHCALAPELATVGGKYFADCRERRPSTAALNEEDAKKLWEVSEKLVGL